MEMKIDIGRIVRDEIDKKLNGLDCAIDKHTKGFMFDSLVYRFKDYQARAFYYEVLQLKHERNLSEIEAQEKVRDRHNRDLMRFIQILDEAIGEHD